MTIDERVRDALHDYADPIEPTPGSWERIAARFSDPTPAAVSPRRGPSRLTAVFAMAALVLVAVLITTLAVRDDGGGRSRVATGVVVMPKQIVALTSNLDLVVLDAATGDVVRTLARDVSVIRGLPELAPTPDGQAVYFTSHLPADPACPSRGGVDAVLRVDVTGGTVGHFGTGQSVAVSPDGRWLAIAGSRDAGCSTSPFLGISVRNLVTGEARQIALASGSITKLSWSPNSRDLAFQWDQNSSYAYVLDAMTATAVEQARCLCAQRDGSSWYGYLNEGEFLGDPPRTTTEPRGAFALGPDAEPLRRLFSFDGTIHDLQADASGTSVLAVGGQMQNGVQVDDLYRWTQGDAAPVKVTDGIVAAAWLPDAQAPPAPTVDVGMPNGIAAIRNGELVVLGSQDGQQHSSLGSAEGATALSATADGRTWVLGAAEKPASCDYNAPGNMTLDKLDTVTGQHTQLAGGAYSPVVSSKGLIAFGYACDGDGLGFTDVRTEKNYRTDVLGSKNFDTAGVQAVYPMAWSPDGTRLLYRVRFAGDPSLHYYVSRLWPAVRELETQVDELPSTEDVTAATFLDDRTVVTARMIAGRSVLVVDGKELVQFPERVISLVADASGQHLLAVTETGELWSWTRDERGPRAVAAPVSSAVWLPWS